MNERGMRESSARTKSLAVVGHEVWVANFGCADLVKSNYEFSGPWYY
jgi:hypothetical protein